MGPATLVAVLSRWAPEEAWARIVAGSLIRPHRAEGRSHQLALGQEAAPGYAGDQSRSWAAAARRLDPPAWWARIASPGIHVTWWGLGTYPAALRDDPQPPGVLFWRGSLEPLKRLCVAVVGTRRASPDGRAVAFELGRDLAVAGVCVVSGLALGIDGAAHLGALQGWSASVPGDDGDEAGPAPAQHSQEADPPTTRGRPTLADPDGPAAPVGVAGSGVDVPYPRRHAALWERVARTGAVLSETLPGRPAEAWHFPARNRIIAGLARMVVVVESHSGGGSLITAEAAIARGIDVRVVPGSVHSPAAAGSNQLLYDGPGPVRDAWDVLDGLGILVPDRDRPRPGATRRVHRSRERGAPARVSVGSSESPPSANKAATAGCPGPEAVPSRHPTAGREPTEWPHDARRVIEAAGWRPASLNQIVRRSGLPVTTTMALLDQLEGAGVLAREGTWWVRSDNDREAGRAR
jgi:DNA processing protein